MSRAITIDRLSKRYFIGRTTASADRLTERLAGAARAPFRRTAALLRGHATGVAGLDEALWALKDISLELQHGQILGVIGRNGAGKSTLLKILSGITEPTTGEVIIHGRVGSLLEVGTGFHPDLTGRENIYLNSAILGMKRKEIEQAFDDIVDFAEIENFLDTPVKHYSSGMYMRLGFAVAAHVEPDILLVDEVLAVGDAAFQKKCLNKMHDVSHKGRTIVFVSHNMTAVQSLCDHIIWLENGQIVERGSPEQVVAHYLQTAFSARTHHFWSDRHAAPGNDQVRLRRAVVRPIQGSADGPITVRTPLALEFEYWNHEPGARLNLSLHIYGEQGQMLFNAIPVKEEQWQGKPFPAGLFRDTCIIPGDLLNNGVHTVELLIVRNDTEIIYRHDEILVFEVLDDPTFRGGWHGKWSGAVRPILDWQTDMLETL